MWVTTLWHEQLAAVQWAVVGLAALLGAVTDLLTRRIPNWLTLPTWGGGLVFAVTRHGTPGLMDALAASVLLALPYLVLYVVAEGGAGDAKMMGAIGAWLGVINGAVALACIALTGVFVAIVIAMRHQRHMKPADAAPAKALAMPYGVPIFLGVLVSAVGVFLWKA